ncbi:MAG: hypothetical protein HS115_01245 [Spirochaetales bacterium]|nr:hypothetical protein [Spirochaetales bacterium]
MSREERRRLRKERRKERQQERQARKKKHRKLRPIPGELRTDLTLRVCLQELWPLTVHYLKALAGSALLPLVALEGPSIYTVFLLSATIGLLAPLGILIYAFFPAYTAFHPVYLWAQAGLALCSVPFVLLIAWWLLKIPARKTEFPDHWLTFFFKHLALGLCAAPLLWPFFGLVYRGPGQFTIAHAALSIPGLLYGCFRTMLHAEDYFKTSTVLLIYTVFATLLGVILSLMPDLAEWLVVFLRL